MIEGKLGSNELLFITDPMDNWNNNTVGSSARVFQGVMKNNGGALKTAAIKIMRTDKSSYALPLFKEEVKVLNALRDIPGVMRMYAMGFIEAQKPIQLPKDSTQHGLRGLEGSVTWYSPDEYKEFLFDLDQKIDMEKENISKESWISPWAPYLIVQIRPREDNLLYLCDPAYSDGRHLHWKKGLEIIAQICSILEAAHKNNIVYRDHKLLHYYYSDASARVHMIDWNIAKLYSTGVSQNEIQHDLVEFGARALHYILTGRHADGALGLGPTRPAEIEAAPNTYNTNWTYDDKRLPDSVKNLIEESLSGKFMSAKDLKTETLKILEELFSSL
jgi:serine/threonine protein kinase